jgi:hypothetical protein
LRWALGAANEETANATLTIAKLLFITELSTLRTFCQLKLKFEDAFITEYLLEILVAVTPE